GGQWLQLRGGRGQSLPTRGPRRELGDAARRDAGDHAHAGRGAGPVGAALPRRSIDSPCARWQLAVGSRQYCLLPTADCESLRQGSCELYTFGWGFGAAKPPQTPSIGEVRRGPGTLWVPPPHLPNCKADRCQAKPCLSRGTFEHSNLPTF